MPAPTYYFIKGIQGQLFSSSQKKKNCQQKIWRLKKGWYRMTCVQHFFFEFFALTSLWYLELKRSYAVCLVEKGLLSIPYPISEKSSWCPCGLDQLSMEGGNRALTLVSNECGQCCYLDTDQKRVQEGCLWPQKVAGRKLKDFAVWSFVSFCFCVAHIPAFLSKIHIQGVRLHVELLNSHQELVNNVASGSQSVFQREFGYNCCFRGCGIQFFGKGDYSMMIFQET